MRDGLISARFRLGELLGTGGSASVFAAVDVTTGIAVALKLLHPHLSENSRLREAFFAEARRMRDVVHPNVVAVLGVGVHGDDGVPGAHPIAWIALERAAGISLSEHVARVGALPVAGAVTVVMGVLRGLEAAHAVGVIHRDVSPSNVMIDVDDGGEIRPDGVRLLDFGLADAAGRSTLGNDILRSSSGETATGEVGDSIGVIGSVDYMSPEQLRGEPVDERGDVYQAGGVFIFSLTGRPPFPRADAAATVRAHLETPPPVPSVLDSRIPRAIDRVVVRALLKHPEDRFASAADMRAAIELVALGRIEPRPNGETRRYVPGSDQAMTEIIGATAPTAPEMRRGPALSTPAPAPSVAAAAAGAKAMAEVWHADAPAPHDEPPRRPGTGGPSASRVGAWIAGIVCVVVIAAILAMAAAATPSNPSGPNPSVSQTPSQAPPASPPPTDQPPTSRGRSTVPELAMLSLSDARASLAAAGLTVGALSIVDSVRPGDTVLSSSPASGAVLDEEAPIALTIASGSNLIPDVTGLSRGAAIAAVQNAGFAVVVADAPPGTQSDTAFGTQPGAATGLRLGTTVTVLIGRDATPTPLPTATPSATQTPTPPTAGATGDG